MLAPEIDIPALVLGEGFDLLNPDAPFPKIFTSIIPDSIPTFRKRIGWESYNNMSEVVESLNISAAMTASYMFASGHAAFNMNSSRLNARHSIGFYITFKMDTKTEKIRSYQVALVDPAQLPPHVVSEVKMGTRMQARFALVFDNADSFK